MSYNRKYKEMRNMDGFEPKEKLKDVQEYPFMDIPERGIRKETCELFGVRTAVSQKDGKTPIAHYFPYYDNKGKLSGYKKRDLTLDKHEKWHFTAIGKVGVECKMFGQDVAEAVERKRKTIYQVEGEWDVLSVYQAMTDQLKGTKYAGMAPFVVGLSCGTVNCAEAVIHNKDFFNSFEEVCVANDEDEATVKEKAKGYMKGHEANETVASTLMHQNTSYIQYPNGYKDPSDMLQEGKGDELAKLFQFGRKKFIAEKIVVASSMELEEILAAQPEGIYTGVFPELDKKLHGFRGYELSVLCAPSNVGKSLVTNEIMYQFLNAGEACGYICLEESVANTIQRILAKKCGVNYNKFKESPLKYCSKEQIEEAYRWLNEDCKAFFLDHFGSLRTDDLMNKVKSFVIANGVKRLLVDHLSMVFSGNASTDERKEVDILMTELAAFCAAHDVSIIAVSHLNRSIAIDFKPPKGKNGEEPDSWWVPVTKEAMRSSSSLEQLAWNVIGLEPQILRSKERGHVRLTVLKNRAHGYLGICDEFIVDDNTGEIILFQDSLGY